MKYNISTDVTTNIQNMHSFGVKNDTKIFKILSDSLYSDKILAVVREIITNAYDIHKQNNVKEKIDIFLPTKLKPYFIVRDYGPGLSEKEIYQLYTTYFASTKDETNEYIGCFGLGSKSPFAYTSTFYVNSYYNGFKYEYVLTFNEKHIPSVVLMNKTKTTEKNGLEVIIPVKEKDFEKYIEDTAKTVYCLRSNVNILSCKDKFFEKYKMHIKPIFLHTKLNDIDLYYYYTHPYNFYRSMIIYNGMYYAVPNNPEFNEIERTLEKYTKYDFNIILDIPTGYLNLTPSRESLSMDNYTINNLREILVKVRDNTRNLFKDGTYRIETLRVELGYYNRRLYKHANVIDVVSLFAKKRNSTVIFDLDIDHNKLFRKRKAASKIKQYLDTHEFRSMLIINKLFINNTLKNNELERTIAKAIFKTFPKLSEIIDKINDDKEKIVQRKERKGKICIRDEGSNIYFDSIEDAVKYIEQLGEKYLIIINSDLLDENAYKILNVPVRNIYIRKNTKLFNKVYDKYHEIIRKLNDICFKYYSYKVNSVVVKNKEIIPQHIREKLSKTSIIELSDFTLDNNNVHKILYYNRDLFRQVFEYIRFNLSNENDLSKIGKIFDRIRSKFKPYENITAVQALYHFHKEDTMKKIMEVLDEESIVESYKFK